MAEVTKKKTRRLKKSIRKTLGTMFLVSALVVAAIPVDNFSSRADSEIMKVTADDTKIPKVDTSKDYNIYTTADGAFQFAYLSTNDVDSANRYAVILGYAGGKLDQYGTLTIPNVVDAYLKYSYTQGSDYGYCAVGKASNFLYYSVNQVKKDANGNDVTDYVYEKDAAGNIVKDENGNPIRVTKKDAEGEDMKDQNGQLIYLTEPVYETVYRPCYNSDYSNWGGLGEEEFFYNEGEVSGGQANDKYLPTDNNHAEYQRIKDATVRYIGNQFLVAGTGADEGTWKVSDDEISASTGIFRGDKAGNIVNLHVGEDLSGIGNYAFYGCTSLQGITLNNGLQTIGNYAFAECINMNKVDIKLNATISAIGDHAFFNCDALTEFSMPVAVQQIGDYAFSNCDKLTAVNLCGGTMTGENGQIISLTNANLRVLGNNVFRNCPSLKEVEFPSNFSESELPISMWYGCSSLTHIKVNNTAVNFVDDTADGNDDFKTFSGAVAPTFYFEGAKPSVLYTTATEHSLAYKYNTEDIYEITIADENDPSMEAVYQVNSSNQLIMCNIDPRMKEIVLPSTIGPYNINTIYSGSFQNKCGLEKITIPSSIRVIEENAFMGCHNLQTVVFAEPVNIESIGSNAFKTQQFTAGSHMSGCDGISDNPKLIFVGPISSEYVPFQYAMEKNSNINYGTQEYSYILYQSGWPSHLEVQYNRSTDKNELVGYPTLLALRDGVYKPESYPYMTQDYTSSAQNAAIKYCNYLADPQNSESLTEFETELIDAVMNIVLPEGIEGIKKDLFKNNEKNEVSGYDLKKTITANSLESVGDRAFAGCTNLAGITLSDTTTSIGTYAFEGCNKLRSVTLPGSVSKLGSRPFKDCGNYLTDVSFSGGPYFTCENSIIYELDPSTGEKVKVIECLEGKTSPLISTDEMAGIKEIAPEAFMDTDIVNVDLMSSKVETIPKLAFAGTSSLTQISLPDTVRSIEDDAFKDSGIRIMKIYGLYQNISNDAFSGTTDKNRLTFYCEEGSGAAHYAQSNGIAYSYEQAPVNYSVSFYDKEGNLLETVFVTEEGAPATPPTPPEVPGYTFTGWMPTSYLSVTENLPFVQAQYRTSDAIFHTVTFVDDDEAATVLHTVEVEEGKDAILPPDPTKKGYVFKGWKGTVTSIMRDETVYAYYEPEGITKYKVTFLDDDEAGTVIAVMEVEAGKDVILPPDPTKEGYVFKGWRGNVTSIARDETVYAFYEPEGVVKHTVSFIDAADNTVLATRTVEHGEDVIAPADPVKAGYTFMGWIGNLTKITRDEIIYANFVANDMAIPKHKVTFVDDDENNTVLYTQMVDDGKDAVIPQSPTKAGYTFKGWKGNLTNIVRDETVYANYEKNSTGESGQGSGEGSGTGTGTGTGTGGGTGTGTTAPTLYTLTVQNGSGSGSYAAGSQPIIIANNPASGQEFSHWTIDPESTPLASSVLSASVITMPATNVTVTAHYKAKTTTSTGSGNVGSTSSGGTTVRPGSTSGTITSGGTTVVIDKNGLSNTGVVSATVKESSDNFTIKVTENNTATEAILRALMGEYGDDLKNLKYFPMDISLYDSTGTTKITDTTGLSINITLPLPDSLIAYAGNNKVACVGSNGSLEKLTPRFTTIDGVACVSFTAEHFSPYVIYVDTTKLSEGLVVDTTPKTGDGIHPKWFLAIGLACMSLVMFFQKDNKKKVKVKAK